MNYMKKPFCLDIEFPNVDFSKYYDKKDVESLHHAHLHSSNNKIELRIYFDIKTNFDYKLMMWAANISANKFGSYLRISNENKNFRMLKMDLSESTLINIKRDSEFRDGRGNYVAIEIDTYKIYWEPDPHQLNTGEFYLAKNGFQVVDEFYSLLFGFGVNFDMKRMKGKTQKYKLLKSKFRPEFLTSSKDKKGNRVASVIKEPKIQFQYDGTIQESEATLYNDIVLLLASFYHHEKIDFRLCRIYMKDYTISIKKIERQTPINSYGGLGGFGLYWDFHKFLTAKWRNGTLKNLPLLKSSIELFNQALLVDRNSEFLIRYNIIEICNRIKPQFKKIKFLKTRHDQESKFEEAFKILYDIVSPTDKPGFKNKWQSISNNLKIKPMKSPLNTFLTSQKLNVNEFPISIDELKALRDNITHGSINKVDAELVRKSNIFLYRINGILILNLMGIKTWKFNYTIKE